MRCSISVNWLLTIAVQLLTQRIKFQKSTCCKSGQLTTDACGCCPVCAKGQYEICGGPWATSGICAKEFHCLKLCDNLSGNLQYRFHESTLDISKRL